MSNHRHDNVSITSDSPSKKSSSTSIRGKEALDSIIDLVHPADDVIGDLPRDRKAVQETLVALRRDYGRVFAALKKHQNTAIEALTRRLRLEDLDQVDSGTLKALEVLRNDRESLRATVEGLNQTLLDQRIRVAELRKANKRYRRERIQLRKDLDAHMAEVNYLTRMSAASSSVGGGDPLVVRKIAKLEERNRELLAKCHKLRSKLVAVSKRGKTARRTRRYRTIKLIYLPRTASVSGKASRITKLSSSNCQVLVSIEPAEMDYRHVDGGGSANRFEPRLVLSRELIDVIREWNRVFLTSGPNVDPGNLTRREILRLKLREEIEKAVTVRPTVIGTDPVLIGRIEFEVRFDLRLNNGSNHGLTKERKSVDYTSEDRFTQTSSEGCQTLDEEIRDEFGKLLFLKKRADANVSCLKNGLNTRSSSSSYRSYAENNSHRRRRVRRSVRFDPEVRCLSIDDIDSKISCAKRTKFIQGARDLFHTYTISLRSSDIIDDKIITKIDETVEPTIISSSDLLPQSHQFHSLLGYTVYNCFV